MSLAFLGQLPFEPVTAILVIPGCAAVLLALLPGYQRTAYLNVLATFLTLLAAHDSARRAPGARRLSVRRRPQCGVRRARHRSSASRRASFSASYIGHEIEIGRLTPGQPALLPRDVPGADVRHEPRAARQQHRPDVGGDRDGDADHRAHGRHLSHPRGAGGGLEVLHSRQCRHRAGVVRHDPRLHGGAPGHRRGPRRDGVDRPDREGPGLQSGAAQRRLRLPHARLRHQGRPGAAPCLAPRRTRRGPDPDLGGAFGAAAECGALRGPALQDAAGGEPGRDRPRAIDGDTRARLAAVCRLHAVSAPRHQTHVRLLLDRAHGAHHFRVRHGRTARQLRRPAAHDDAQPDQVGDLLRRRPYRAGQGHAEAVRDPRADREPSGAGLGPGGRGRRHRRTAAARHFHERVPDRQLDVRPRAAAGDTGSCSAFWSPSAP